MSKEESAVLVNQKLHEIARLLKEIDEIAESYFWCFTSAKAVKLLKQVDEWILTRDWNMKWDHRVILDLPQGIVDFLRDMQKSPMKYAERKVIEALGADLDTLDIFPFKEPEQVREVIRKYGLSEVLQGTVAKEFC